jgi:hypothetical protein
MALRQAPTEEPTATPTPGPTVATDEPTATPTPYPTEFPTPVRLATRLHHEGICIFLEVITESTRVLAPDMSLNDVIMITMMIFPDEAPSVRRHDALS